MNSSGRFRNSTAMPCWVSPRTSGNTPSIGRRFRLRKRPTEVCIIAQSQLLETLIAQNARGALPETARSQEVPHLPRELPPPRTPPLLIATKPLPAKSWRAFAHYSLRYTASTFLAISMTNSRAFRKHSPTMALMPGGEF